MALIGIEEATPETAALVRGRPSSTRAEWEAAREADAADLNRLLERGGEVRAYVAPLWSNLDAERCLAELRGFDEARVYAELAPGEGEDLVLAALAEIGWAGAAPPRGEGLPTLEEFIYACAGLELPVLLPETALPALARALGEDLSPREIAAVLRGEDVRAPDPDSLDYARELTPDAW